MKQLDNNSTTARTDNGQRTMKTAPMTRRKERDLMDRSQRRWRHHLSTRWLAIISSILASLTLLINVLLGAQIHDLTISTQHNDIDNHHNHNRNHNDISNDNSNGINSRAKVDVHAAVASGKVAVIAATNRTARKSFRRIRYSLHRNRPYPAFQLPREYTCDDPNDENRTDFPPDPSPGVWDFTVHIETDLGILFIGDSVAHQLSITFEQACGATTHVQLERINTARYEADLINVAANNIRGGGAVAFWRMIGLWSLRMRGHKLPNRGEGWRPWHVEAIMNVTNYEGLENRKRFRHITKRKGTELVAYDVVVHRLNHPWKRSISLEELHDCLDLVEMHPKGRVVIFMTAYPNNNIMSQEDWNEMRAMNDFVKTFARNYSTYVKGKDKMQKHNLKAKHTEKDNPFRVQHILIADVERYVNETYRYNADQLGYNGSDDSIFFQRLRPDCTSPTSCWARKVPMYCAERVPNNSKSCLANSLFQDGMHMCVERMGPRINGVLACLTACVYERPKMPNGRTPMPLEHCEKVCNDRFMTVNPISASDILDD